MEEMRKRKGVMPKHDAFCVFVGDPCATYLPVLYMLLR